MTFVLSIECSFAMKTNSEFSTLNHTGGPVSTNYIFQEKNVVLHTKFYRFKVK